MRCSRPSGPVFQRLLLRHRTVTGRSLLKQIAPQRKDNRGMESRQKQQGWACLKFAGFDGKKIVMQNLRVSARFKEIDLYKKNVSNLSADVATQDKAPVMRRHKRR